MLSISALLVLPFEHIHIMPTNHLSDLKIWISNKAHVKARLLHDFLNFKRSPKLPCLIGLVVRIRIGWIVKHVLKLLDYWVNFGFGDWPNSGGLDLSPELASLNRGTCIIFCFKSLLSDFLSARLVPEEPLLVPITVTIDDHENIDISCDFFAIT